MTYTRESIESVRKQTDILSVVGQSIQLEKRGKDFFGLCPFHAEKTPSFSVNPEKGLYYCFGCGARGDAIDFVVRTRGLSFADAVRELAAACGVILAEDTTAPGPDRYSLPETRSGRTTTLPPPSGPTDPSLPSEAWRQKAHAFVMSMHQSLMTSRRALNRLAKSRGIRKDTAIRFRLGMNPAAYWRPRRSWGLEDVTGRNGRIIRNFCIDRGLVIPNILRSSRPPGTQDIGVTRIRIRRPEGEPKYKLVPGSSTAPMIIDGHRRCAVVVESELCAMLLSQEIDDLATVIAMGSAMTRPDAETDAVLRECAVILLALDFDDAGKKALSWWRETYSGVIRWPVPEGKDPTDAFLAGIDLTDWIKAGIPGMCETGPSRLTRKQRGGGEFSEQSTLPVPEGVKKLAELLAVSPVTIVNGESRIAIKEPRGWAAKHWERSKAVSDAVYLDPEVFDYLCGHPDKFITAKNLVMPHFSSNPKKMSEAGHSG